MRWELSLKEQCYPFVTKYSEDQENTMYETHPLFLLNSYACTAYTQINSQATKLHLLAHNLIIHFEISCCFFFNLQDSVTFKLLPLFLFLVNMPR